MKKHDYSPISLDSLSTYSLSDRKSKVSSNDFATPWNAGGGLADFFKRLPDILGAKDLTGVVASICDARRNRRPVVMAMGAHVIKVGLNPVVVDLMKRGVVNAVAMNGAGIIHDFELAFSGKTSEDVDAAIGDGSFGMARETGVFLSEAVKKAGREGLGLGEAVGRSILEGFPNRAYTSITAEAARLGIPVTVHIAMGTDILHMHPDFDPAAAGEASHRDFRIFASVISDIEGGVYMNIGSAVILPEVFLKAVTLVRNLGHRIEKFTTVNLDFIRHYRPMTNVVNRPTASGGKGFHLTGPHEILIPLIAAGVIEGIDDPAGSGLRI